MCVYECVSMFMRMHEERLTSEMSVMWQKVICTGSAAFLGPRS